MANSSIPLADQLAEVERELSMRERVYPKWVQSGRMKVTEADRQIARMRAVRDTLRGLTAAAAAPALPL